MDVFLKDVNKRIILSDKVFNFNFNVSLVHQIVKSYRINCRKGSVSQKSRSEVSGSNKKPWRQKGTGKARVGSLKSPIWRSGGVTFASKYKKYNVKINRKMYRHALKSILSKLLKESRLFVVNDFNIDLPKTRCLVDKLNIMKLRNVLIIVKKIDRLLFLASRNLFYVNICSICNINIIDLINYKNTLFTLESIKILERKLLNGK